MNFVVISRYPMKQKPDNMFSNLAELKAFATVKSLHMILLFLGTALCYEPLIVPWPNSLVQKNGTWTLSRTSQIGYQTGCEDSERVANFAATQLRKSTGYPLEVVSGSVRDGISFKCNSELAKEEYVLDMDSFTVEITGSKYAGLFWGYQTLLQLLPAEATLPSVQRVPWVAETVRVEDKPRFEFRGVMADPSRRWLNATEMKMIIDRLARFKLNYFHFHFADDQGWRLESKKYPLLTQIGSIRKSSPQRWDPNKQDNVEYGPYWYTVEEVKEIIEYAKERAIEIIPELEMPGHGHALLAAYPQYYCLQEPLEVLTRWGVHSNLYCAGSDETIHFLEDLADEVIELFNESKYIHLGGDESPKDNWKKCPLCQKRIADEGLKDANQLQFWLVKHFAEYLRAKGKMAIEWDDYAKQGVPENTAVMAWLTDGRDITNMDRYVIQARSTILYFPQKQFTAFDRYEYTSFSSLHSLKLAYDYDPHNNIQEAKKQFVLGAEAPVWGEYIWNITDYDWKLFPRGMALAEVTWTNKDRKSWPRIMSMMARSKIADIRKNGVNSAPLTITPEGEWYKDEIPSDHWVTIQWPVKGNFQEAGKLQAAFVWKGGRNGLRVRNVKLVVDGTVASTDAHESVAFDTMTSENIYSLTTQQISNKKVVAVTAEVKGEGGSDTQGAMYCYPVNN